MDMLGAYHSAVQLPLAAGDSDEPQGFVLSGAVSAGQPLSMDARSDLAIVLTGALRTPWGCEFAIDRSGPTVLLRSDVHGRRTFAIRDLLFLSMSERNCASLLEYDSTFRALFFGAMSTRIRALMDAKARLAVTPRRVLH